MRHQFSSNAYPSSAYQGVAYRSGCVNRRQTSGVSASEFIGGSGVSVGSAVEQVSSVKRQVLRQYERQSSGPASGLVRSFDPLEKAGTFRGSSRDASTEATPRARFIACFKDNGKPHLVLCSSACVGGLPLPESGLWVEYRVFSERR